jgi:hypothetical protein
MAHVKAVSFELRGGRACVELSLQNFGCSWLHQLATGDTRCFQGRQVLFIRYAQIRQHMLGTAAQAANLLFSKMLVRPVACCIHVFIAVGST